MTKRIFIAINLPEDVRKKLADFRKDCPDLPVHWTKKENLHITLSFIGYIDDEELLKVIKQTKQAVEKCQSFTIDLKKIDLGPTGKSPRMIWAIGETNPILSELKNRIEKELSQNNFYQEENRPYYPHITLARIKPWEWRKDKKEISQEISLSFEVDSIDIMESVLTKKGPEYFVLESISLE